MSKWVSLTCPRCRERLRIKAAYAHLPGRCPECGLRLLAPRPRPSFIAPPPTRESFDLVPLEEEWPEPAEFEGRDARPTYGLTSSTAWPEPPRPDPTPDVAGYELAHGEVHAPPPKIDEPEHDPYAVGPAHVEEAALPVVAAPFQLSIREREPLRAPPPPRWPLWQGIFDFPFRMGNLRVLLYQSLSWTVTLFLIEATVALFQLMQSGEKTGSVWPLLMIPSLAALLVVGAFTASYFMAIVQDTAAGNDDVRWPDDPMTDRLLRLFLLLWLLVCSLVPLGFLWVLAPGFMARHGPVLIGGGVVVLFPLMLLSVLAADSSWIVLHRGVLGRVVRRPAAAFLMFVMPLAVLAPALTLAYQAVVQSTAWLLPVTALAWSAGAQVYGRMLGRAGWFMSDKRTKKAEKGK